MAPTLATFHLNPDPGDPLRGTSLHETVPILGLPGRVLLASQVLGPMQVVFCREGRSRIGRTS